MIDHATSPTGARVQPESELTTGLRTSPEFDSRHPALRITWIDWHSAFRRTGLRVGDRIIAVNGVPVGAPEPQEFQRLLPTLIGQAQESRRWEDTRTPEGAPLTLTVRRRRVPGEGWEVLDFRGAIVRDRFYHDTAGWTLLGAGGPALQAHVSFDFGTSWGSWYASFLKQASQVLDDVLQSHSWDGGSLMEEPGETQARVDFLVRHYPGPFSQAVHEDWEAVRARLGGRQYKRNGSGHAYLEQGSQRVEPSTEPPAPRSAGLPPDTASPREVLETMGQAVQAEDVETFRQLFVSWRAAPLGNGQPLYSPRYEYNLDRLWTDLRWLAVHRSWAARVVWTGDVYTLIPASPEKAIPRVEAVDVQLEHLGLFHGGPRAWPSGAANLGWELQRLEGGPWRISSIQGL